MLQEFKDFILKGNAIDLAVGVLIGAAFGGLVKSVTEGIINPIISWLGGDVQVSLQLGIFDVGMVINAAFSLLITGFVLFFIFVKPMNKLRALKSKPEPPAPVPEPSAEEKLLTEIRDLLKNRSVG
jgi:large conductance mechanosensitive channel